MNDSQPNDFTRNLSAPHTHKAQAGSALAAINADDHWLFEQLNQGAFEGYEGQFIVVYNKQVVAHDRKYLQAQQKAVKQVPDVPVTRFAVKYVSKVE